MKALICIDDDSQYEAVLAAPQKLLALESDDEILVAHAVATLRWLPLKGDADATGWAGTEREILQRVDDFLDGAVDTLRQRGAKAKALRLEGDVASELLKAAHEHDVDVIVTGAIGQARGQDFLVGSVSEKIESLTERDLILIRAEEKPQSETPSGGVRVTVAIDDTPASFSAIESFANKFRVDDAAIEWVHVMNVPPPRFDAAPEGTESKSSVPPVVRQAADHAVNHAQELLSSRGLHPRLALRRGDPAREVLEATRAFDADLVVVGRGGHKTQKRLAGLAGPLGWRGTVARRVARYAPCSVYIAATAPSQRDTQTEGDHESQGSRADGR